MARKIKAKLILQLHAGGMSQNRIAKTQKISTHSVSDVLHAADELGITWEDVESKTDTQAYAMVFPNKVASQEVYEDPDWEHIHSELAKSGVTLKLLHAEYADECSAKGKPHMGYDRFCKRYRRFTVQKNVVSRVGHKAARIMEVDWSGPTMQLVNPVTGEVMKVYLFVACLPFSRYVYVEPTLDMTQDTWLRCHVHAFQFFGGSVPCIVPDNLKTGVTKHPKEGEIILNDAYQEMATHYSAAVLPARVASPKDKPSVENEVRSAATDIIARLRHEVFTDFQQLKVAVAEKLAEHNAAPFTKRKGSRRDCFVNEEQPQLRPLPAVPYEVCRWHYDRKVQLNCHVAFQKNFYSVPHLAVGQKVDLRVTDTTLEVYQAGLRLSTHPLFPDYVTNRYSTHEGDLPEGKSYSDWDGTRIRNWAERIGESCSAVIERIFQSVKFEEQGYNSALSVLRLQHKYGADRLERACSMALATGKQSPRYREISTILKSNQDKIIAPDELDAFQEESMGYVRGAGFYERL